MTPQLVADCLENAMAEEFENYGARLEEARRAVERWEAEGGARETEQPAERAPDAVPDGEPTLPPGESGDATHARGEATERKTMNRMTVRRMQLRDLAERVAHARYATVQQTLERESAMRRDGAAHPRSIRADRRLTRTLHAYRDLATAYRRRAREEARHRQ
jgi:hypothetical protein